MKILDNVGSLLANLQGNKFLEKVSKQKDQGFFKSEADFNQAIRDGLANISSSQNQPLFTPSLFSPGLAYSEIFNNNIEGMLLDIEVLFGEVNFLFSKIKSHEIFFERAVKEAEVLTKRLEQNLESAKIETAPENIFNKIIFNSFDDASNKMDFKNTKSKELYFDFKKQKRVRLSGLSTVNIDKGKLTLPEVKTTNVEVAEAKVLSTQSTVSDFDISLPGNRISNIINANFSESWTETVLTRKPQRDGARLVVTLDLGDLKEFNSVQVNPNASEPIYLEEVYTVDSAGTKRVLDIAPGLISEIRTYNFDKVIAKEVYFSFKQDRSKAIPYDPSEGVSLAELQRDKNLPLTIDSISGQINESIKDPSIKNIIGVDNKRKNESLLLYSYSFSINAISLGNESFREEGIYVSKNQNFKRLRNVGLYKEDFIPTIVNWESGEEMPGASIEYVLVKKDFNESNRIIKTSKIDILPIGTQKIENELLYFATGDSATLRFKGHTQNGDGSNIKVRRNGELLIRGIDWKFENLQTPGDPSTHMIEASRDETTLTITQANQQRRNGVYTVEYTPSFILEPENVFIQNGVRFNEDCSLIVPNIVFGQEVMYSDLYVQTVMRAHSKNPTTTPYIDWYRLGGKEE